MNSVDNFKKAVMIKIYPLGMGLFVRWRNVMINLTPEALGELKNMFDTRRDLSYGVRVFVKAVG